MAAYQDPLGFRLKHTNPWIKSGQAPPGRSCEGKSRDWHSGTTCSTALLTFKDLQQYHSSNYWWGKSPILSQRLQSYSHTFTFNTSFRTICHIPKRKKNCGDFSWTYIKFTNQFWGNVFIVLRHPTQKSQYIFCYAFLSLYILSIPGIFIPSYSIILLQFSIVCLTSYC